jgi:hypothetical protein
VRCGSLARVRMATARPQMSSATTPTW